MKMKEMKKIFLTAILASIGFCGFAQSAVVAEEEELTITKTEAPVTSKGYKILPEEGDFALGIDATPFFEYIGNMFNGTVNNKAPWFGGEEGEALTIIGKYFLKDNRAIRASLSLNVGSTVTKKDVMDDYANNTPGMYNNQTVIDVKKVNGLHELGLTAGYEYRRGYRRLQGFYGPEIGIEFSKTKTKYTYANEITEANQIPTWYDFEEDALGTSGERTLESKNGATLGISLGGFAGVEYFIAPKLSIGGEVGLGLKLSNTWQNEKTVEQWSQGEENVVEYSTRSLDGETGSVDFGTKFKATGKIFIMFHF